MAESVPVPPSTALPFMVRLPTISLKAPMAKVAPLATVTAAALASRFDAPRVSVPLLTLTVPAPALPFSATAPPTVSAPGPRSAFTVPPLSA